MLAFKAICKGDREILKVYKKVDKPVDSLKYIRPERTPAYHADPNCPALRSDYEKVAIPEQIIEQGKDVVLAWRRYWNENSELRDRDFGAFIAHVNLKFKLDPPVRVFEKTIVTNSGIHEVSEEKNRSVSDINKRIEEIYNELVSWVREDKHRRLSICMNYGYLSWTCNQEKHIDKPLPSWIESEEKLKEQLRIIDRYKQRICSELQELYMRQYISNDLDFDASLLQSLGFEPCFVCTFNNGGNE